MKLKLSQLIIETDNIKKLHNRPKKLYAGMGKNIKTNYCIEYIDGTFTEITKQEYKKLKQLVEKVKE